MNTPQRILMAIGLTVTTAIGAMAIPATPHPVTVTQPDGTTLTLRMEGDENGFVMLTEDGRPVIQNPESGRYEVVEGRPKSRIAKAKARQQKRIKISNYPTIGEQKSLVILVEFADTKFSSIPDPYDYYNRMLNEEGFVWEHNGAVGSARDFYIASSDGNFRPDFRVFGPVVLDKELKYYGGDSLDYLDENAIEMVIEAASTLDEEIDYSEFDADGDGYIDNIYFFYAGYGQADSGKGEVIWPHAGQLETNWGRELILDGKRIDHYACSNEIRANTAPDFKPVGIGTFVHEFGHVLGLADHYDTSYSSGRTGVNNWDTMAGASYHNNQNTPPLFNAFERAELGWLEYTDIAADQAGWLDIPSLDMENKAYRIVVQGTGGKEYFVLENRRKLGWDSYLPGEGMLVWHVDMDENRWWDNTVNTDPVHQCLDLVEADGRETETTYTSDPFPGKSNVTQFSFMNWNGEEEFLLDHIIQSDGTASLLLGNTSFLPEKPKINIARIGGKTLSFTWSAVDNAQGYELLLLNSDGNSMDVFCGDNPSEPEDITIETLVPNSVYRLGVTTLMGSYRSETAWVDVNTSDILFFETTPVINEDMEIGPNQFTIRWLPLEGADDYEVNLERLAYSDMNESTCGFTQLELPWETNNLKFNKALYGETSPSLQLDNDGDWLSFTTDGGRISELSFWVRSQSSSNSYHIEIPDPETGEWVTLAEENPGSGAGTFSYEIPESPAVRIVFDKVSGYMLIDDIKCIWQPEVWAPLPMYTGVITPECFFTPTCLEEETQYRATVTGLKDEEKSKPAVCRIMTVSASGLEKSFATTRTLKSSHDLFGNRVEEDAKGIVICVYSDGTVTKRINL